MKNLDIDKILEIGAGDYNNCFSRSYKDLNIEIILFEPNPLFYNNLVKNFKDYKNIKIFHQAFSTHDRGDVFYNFGLAGWIKNAKCFANTLCNLDGEIPDYEKFYKKIETVVPTYSVANLVTNRDFITENTLVSMNCNIDCMWILNNIRIFPKIFRCCFYAHTMEQWRIINETIKWMNEHNYNHEIICQNKLGTFFEILFYRVTPNKSLILKSNINTKKPLNIFYHFLCINDCLERFKKTFNKIKSSGLLEECENIHISINGIENLDFYEKELSIHDKIKTYKFNQNFHGEMNTLNLLWDFSQNNDSYLMYLYGKGITHVNKNDPNFNIEAIESWKDYMEYFNIIRYKDCLEKLKEYDTCGVDYSEWGQGGWHYAGNFWWADSEYIRRLPKMNVKTRYRKTVTDDERWFCEFWLMDNEHVRAASLHQALGTNGYLVNHYMTIYGENIYAK